MEHNRLSFGKLAWSDPAHGIKSALNLSLIRWGRFSAWKIVRWNFTDAVMLTEKGEITIGTGKGERQ